MGSLYATLYYGTTLSFIDLTKTDDKKGLIKILMMSILSSITISQDRSRIMFIESVELDVLRNLVPPSV